MQDKAQIRKAALAQRGLIENRAERSERIWALLVSAPELKSFGTLFGYSSTASEVETGRFLEEASNRGKEVALPYCAGSNLEFYAISDFKNLELGAFGILAPNAITRDSPAQRRLPKPGDIVLVPGVAFTRYGARIGYGAGYYDRFLANLPNTVIKIGLSYSSQLQEAFVEEPFDIRMDLIVCEDEVIRTPLA